mmetsp:Transcript_22669/g.53525  ORF Transcript_22669/g.53525 Transcript_22669/m.53525 type:complete len:290 (+) Transcript_22669:67-936(+)
MKFLLVVAALLGLAAAVTQPTFDGDWSAFTANELDIAQGEYQTKGNEVCCSTTAAACKVQTVDETGKIWQSFSRQAIRQNVPGGSIVTFLTENPQYQYAVVENANGTLTCESKCPLTGQNKLEPLVKDWFIAKAGNGTEVSYKGTAAYPGSPNACGKGKECEVWEVKTTLLGIVVMETDTLYVNVAGSSPIPVADVGSITPFGEHIGTEKTLYQEYQGFPNGLPASVFDILNKGSCPPPNGGCNRNNGGNGGNGLSRYQTMSREARNWRSHITEKVKGRFAFDIQELFN